MQTLGAVPAAAATASPIYSKPCKHNNNETILRMKGQGFLPGMQTPVAVYNAVYSPLRLQCQRWLATMVEREVPFLVQLQKNWRTKFLDQYFQLSAIIGNHMFFFTVLPVLNWLGLGLTARTATYVVLTTVYLTGIAKDYFSAPRPASPPVQRLSLNSDHSTEYGFPSTHSAYVVATASFLTSCILASVDEDGSGDGLFFRLRSSSLLLLLVIWFTGLSIIVGRVYCGMHSVIDVTGGVLAGISTAYFFTASSQAIDGWICGGGLQVPAIILFAHFCSIYFHITAIDNCPCYIDNTSAISVVSGVMFGYWQRAFVSDRDMHGSPRHYDIVFNYQSMGLSRALLRILVGLSVLFAWKICSKPLMIGLIERWRNLRCWLPAHPGYYNVPTDPAAVCKGQDLQYHQASDSGYATESSVTSGVSTPLSRAMQDTAAAPLRWDSLTHHRRSDRHWAHSDRQSEEPSSSPLLALLSAEDISTSQYGTYYCLYSSENLSRIPTYFGIGYLTITLCVAIFKVLGI